MVHLRPNAEAMKVVLYVVLLPLEDVISVGIKINHPHIKRFPTTRGVNNLSKAKNLT